MKNGLIGCGIVGFLCLIAVIGWILYARRNPQVLTDYVMRQVEGHYAADVTEQDKAELRAAYAGYRERLRHGGGDSRAMLQIRSTIMRGGPRNEFTRDQVHDLTAAFRDASGSARPTPAATLVPLAPATPSP